MAFTIRKLSEQAEQCIKKIMLNEYVNTKSKAIEYALERFELIEYWQSECSTLRKEKKVLEEQIQEIKYAISILQKIDSTT